MNHEGAWSYMLDMLEGTPVGEAAEQCKPIAYDATGSRTFTILAPNRQVAYAVDSQSVVQHIKDFLLIVGDTELNLDIQVEADDEKVPEYAVFAGWAQVLEALQAESPRASFDTWIRETWPVSLSDGTLTIGARNAYAAEWLNNRVSERAGTLASTLLGKRIKVKFIWATATGTSDEKDDDNEPGGEEELRDAPGKNKVEAAYDTAYSQEVKPEQRIALPGYALRLLRHGDLSPKEMTLWVAFRQSTYHRWSREQPAVKNIPHWDVLRYANMSRSSLEREIAKAENGKICGGLVSILPEDASAFTRDPRFDYARRYQVQVNPRLTRRDCNAIHSILYRAISMTTSMADALAVTEKTLNELTERQPTSYLEDSQNQEHSLNGWPCGVAEIVRVATGYKGDLPEGVHKAAEQLQERIISGFGLAMIPLYFLHTVAPRLNLTQWQTWAVIVMRYRCAYDPEENETLGYALFHGGLDELAERSGASVKSLRRWMNDASFSMFAAVKHVSDENIPEYWTSRSLLLDICQTEPIIAEGTECYTARDKMTHDQGQNDTRPGTECYTARDKMTHDQGQNDTRLKRSIKFQPRANKIHESPQTPRLAAQKPGRVGSRAYWDWDFLMSRNAVSMPMSKKLLIANKAENRDIAHLCQKFISWILYGYSEAGRGLSNPVSNALARLKENAYTGAGGDFDRLAALSPNTLRAYIDLDLAGRDLPDSHLADAYTHNFINLPKAAKRELRGRLFE
ncbi:MAG: DnaA N-terminal domain-containing protein [Anaerolineales bacterium]|nr:DnaA N-terminal domain-containing protein [Anaerolineales bacterium]